MTLQKRFSPYLWVLALVLSSAFIMWTTGHRRLRVEYVSSLAGGAEMAGHPHSAQRDSSAMFRLIVPERNERSYEWIAHTREMLARHEWRIRHVDYENAPQGHGVMATSPYRWWLGFLAWVDHRVTGRPAALSVERAALWSDPVAQLLFLVVLTPIIARQWGGWAAAIFSLGGSALYPFAAGFWPGAPDHHAIARLLGLTSVLLILLGMMKAASSRKWFAWSGVLGGIALWIDVPTQMTLFAGLLVGQGLSAIVARRRGNPVNGGVADRPGWRMWSLAGAVTVLGGYLIEYAPDYLGSWHLETVHPMYGVVWLGTGELMTRLADWGERRHAGFSRRVLGLWVLSLAAIAALPLAMHVSGSRGYVVRDLLSLRLTNEPGGVVATDFRSWFSRDGFDARMVATLLPLLGVLPLAWLMRRDEADPARGQAMAIVAGPLLFALVIASRQLSAWGLVDGVLLILAVVAVARRPYASTRFRLTACGFLIAFLVIPGAAQLWPRGRADASLVLSASEAEELIERDLARWLRMRADRADTVVFAPPRETLTLACYGDFRGIGTFSSENTAGFGTSLMIAGVQTMEEVQALLQPRGVRYIVVPSWDPFFDEFGRLYLAKNFSNRKSFFIGELRRGNLPRWLRPLAYPMPEIPGFEKQSVLVFEVVDEQGPAIAASRLAEYFVETGELERAAAVAGDLQQFPGDVSALTARAQVLGAREDFAGVEQAVTSLQSRLANGGDRYLPWDRRVALAVVLARSGKLDLAKVQAIRCWTEANASRLKALPAGSLFGLMVLGDTFKADLNPELRSLALELLPAGLRARL